MSLISDLIGKVFGKKDDAKEEAETAVDGAAEMAEDAAGSVAESADTAEPEGEAVADAAAPEPVSEVDVEAMLNEMASNSSEDLEWKLSIVDLLKLVGLDSSYGARKEMALELGYNQEDIDSKGSAEMNIWLHRQVMSKFAENGGKLPADLPN